MLLYKFYEEKELIELNKTIELEKVQKENHFIYFYLIKDFYVFPS